MNIEIHSNDNTLISAATLKQFIIDNDFDSATQQSMIDDLNGITRIHYLPVHAGYVTIIAVD